MIRRTKKLAQRPLYKEALVVFSGQTEFRLLRVLRCGFRHCFVALCDGERWITYDPLSHRTEILVQTVPADFDLPGYYARQGLTALTVRLAPVPARMAPWRPFTCVEATKRAIGMHAPWVLTPWQLYRRLRQSGRVTAVHSEKPIK